MNDVENTSSLSYKFDVGVGSALSNAFICVIPGEWQHEMIYVYIFILYKVYKYSILSYSIELRSHFFSHSIVTLGGFFFPFFSLVFTSFSLQSCCAIEYFWILACNCCSIWCFKNSNIRNSKCGNQHYI